MNLDLQTPVGVTLALLPEIVLTIGAMAALLAAAFRHRDAADSRLAGYIALATLVASAACLGWLWLNNAAPVARAHMVALDGFRYAASGLFLLSAGYTIIISLPYTEREGLVAPEYHALVLFATAGMMFMAGASDLIVLFLGLEVMSVAVYVLAGFDRRSQASAEAALKYFLLGAFASGFLLYGIALVYGATGHTSLALIGQRLAVANPPLMLSLGIGLLLIGFAFKVSAVPFHMWAPDAYDGAPTPVTGFMAAGVKAAAFAALVRVMVEAFPSALARWQPIIGILAFVTMAVGSVVALVQPSIKRMLAYSSIVHAGYLLVGVWAGTRAGATAVLGHLVAYVLTTLASFALLANLGENGERDVTLDDLAGLSRAHPWTAAALAICMLSLLGFPGTIGFIGKWMLLSVVVAEGQWLLAVTLVLGTLLSAGYYLPVITAAYMKPAPADLGSSVGRLPRLTAAVVGLSVAAIVALGFLPGPVLSTARASSATIPAPEERPRLIIPGQ